MEPNQFVARDLADLAPGNMVDLAGGEGRNALWFAKRGWQVENVEISKVALEKFQLRAEHSGVAENCRSNLAQAQQAAFQLEPDLVVIAYLQIPFEQLQLAIENAISQSEKGTRIFGVWHALRNLTEGFGGPPMAEVLPTPEELTGFAAPRLSEFEVYEIDRIVEKDGVKHKAIDVILSGRL